ncbi:hypothetical protein ACFL3A_12090 [Pseudomonadota bacterium]
MSDIRLIRFWFCDQTVTKFSHNETISDMPRPTSIFLNIKKGPVKQGLALVWLVLAGFAKSLIWWWQRESNPQQ